ncbi:MAG: hypothetical protein ACE5JD_03955 [Candidatus Methylomirabilia bacterium]
MKIFAFIKLPSERAPVAVVAASLAVMVAAVGVESTSVRPHVRRTRDRSEGGEDN